MESDVTIRRWLTKVLSGASLEVLTASNGPIDLAISDLAPERLETIRALRAVQPRLKIIATAEALTPGVLRAADLMGAQAVLTKPYGPKAVTRRVSEILRSRPATYFANEEPSQFPPTRRISR